MGIEGQSSPSTTPEHNVRQRQVKSVATVEIYRPPAARRASKGETQSSEQSEQVPPDISAKSSRQRRPDRAVYIPRHRREAEAEGSPQSRSRISAAPLTAHARSSPSVIVPENTRISSRESSSKNLRKERELDSDHNFECKFKRKGSDVSEDCPAKVDSVEEATNQFIAEQSKFQEEPSVSLETRYAESIKEIVKTQDSRVEVETMNERNRDVGCEEQPESSHKRINVPRQSFVSDVLIISGKDDKGEDKEKKDISIIPMTPPEKKVKKIERQKSKPASPPSPPLKINRDECDWDSLFDENGDCLDPTLIEELTSAVGEVMIEQPKNDYKAYTKPVEVSKDEFAHVIEIYNFPSEFKTSDLAAVFSPFKNGGFEFKWVDDTHCLGVFSSPLIAAEVLASDHPFVKTRPLSEATALSKTKARRSSEFLQPYRSRPETCAALARRLVTGALGVKLATARQEREHEKIVLREAKEKRRLANKQREDAWEGVIAQK